MAQQQEPSPGRAEMRVKAVLVVEDDLEIGAFLVKAIEQELSHEVLLVTDGFQALKVVRDLKPNLFLLDYHLPSMDGIELYDQLHATKGFETIPAIMLSARLPQQQLKERGIIGLHKPVELDALLHTIAQMLS